MPAVPKGCGERQLPSCTSLESFWLVLLAIGIKGNNMHRPSSACQLLEVLKQRPGRRQTRPRLGSWARTNLGPVARGLGCSCACPNAFREQCATVCPFDPPTPLPSSTLVDRKFSVATRHFSFGSMVHKIWKLEHFGCRHHRKCTTSRRLCGYIVRAGTTTKYSDLSS